LEAIKDLLQKVNIPFDLNQEKLMQQTLTLQAKLNETDSTLKTLQKSASDMKRELEDAKQASVCPICREEEISVCLVSCGHTVCETCAKSWQQRSNVVKCPYCRSDVIQFVKLYKP
jgi:Zn finger protein HypA/HybF involved in hydrogenase expression